MKIIYMGTPDFAVEALEALASSRHEVTAVFTQPDITFIIFPTGIIIPNEECIVYYIL